MNDIMQVNRISKTMSSREIATLCVKCHEHVCRDIELLNTDYVNEGIPKIGDTLYTNQQNGQQYREYILSQQQCLDLLTGYSRPMRIRVNLRWAELEQKEAQASQPVIAMPDFTNPAEAARAFADQYEAKQLAQEQLALAQPKVDFYNAVAASNSTIAVGDVAKKMNMSAQELNKKLIEIGAYDKRRLPKKVFNDGFIRKGYAEMSLTQDGYDRNRLTQAGQIYVTGLFGRSREVELAQ